MAATTEMSFVRKDLLHLHEAFGKSSVGGVDLGLLSLEFAAYLDAADPLRHLRDEFCVPLMKELPNTDLSLVDSSAESVYLCGHSLGLKPKICDTVVEAELKKWTQMGVFGHTHGAMPWADADEFGLEGCAQLAGAKVTEIAIMNSLSVNLHLLMVSFYRPTAQRNKILLERKAFPSDHYAIESQIRFHGFDPVESMVCLEPRKGESCLRVEDIESAISAMGNQICLVLFSGVQYYTGQLFDIERITRVAQSHGCTVGWDLAHAAGNVPLKLHDWNVDFAAWCSYKYMNSSAGGIGVVFLHENHADNQFPKFLGWWGHKKATRFQMTNVMELSPSPAAYRISNPSGLLMAALMASLQVFAKTDMTQLRQKSFLLTGFLELLIDENFGLKSPHRRTDWSVEVITPRDPLQRGCQLSLRFSTDVDLAFKELQKRGVACDLRVPNVIRVAPVHLYNSFVDVWRFIEALKSSMEEVGKC